MIVAKLHLTYDDVAPYIGVLLGVLVGWALTTRTSAKARADERKHAQEQRVRQRELDTAAALDVILLTILDMLPTPIDEQNAERRLHDAELEWRRGWVQSGVLDGTDLNDRYRAVGQVLRLAERNVQLGAEVPFDVPDRAISNARVAIARLQREEDPPPPWFPSSDELNDLLGDTAHGTDWSRLVEWLNEHPPAL
jgi:hypothetical protein